jgi:hypothetical protein
MATLPNIDFAGIAETAKAALVAYGTPAEFQEKGSDDWRAIKVVVYKDEKAVPLIGDASSKPATAILNPDEFVTPYRIPKRFDSIRVTVGAWSRTYTVDSVHPILAQETLPLLLVQLTAN